MSTTSNLVRPLGLWEYIEAGGKLEDVLGTSVHYLAEDVEIRGRYSRAMRRRAAEQSRYGVEHLLTEGMTSNYVPRWSDGTTPREEAIQRDAWREQFRADLFEATDDQVSMLVRILRAAGETVYDRPRPTVPITIGDPEGRGWQCANCCDVYEPLEARAFISQLSDGSSVEYCVSCVSQAAALMGAGTFERGFRAGHALGVKGGSLPEHFAI